MNKLNRFLPIASMALRIALALAFLSAVADRFGLWGAPGSPNVAWGTFNSFLEYTGLLLWFLPPTMVAASGWVATVLEIVFAIGLLSGYYVRWFALASSFLLLAFAISMTIALGPEPTFSYSVWTAAASAFLLACLGGSQSMPSGTIRHNRVTLNCASYLLIQLRGKQCQPHNSDTKLRIRSYSNTRFYYPVVQVVCESNPATSAFQDHPVLIIEVLSPSTRAYDLDEKLTAYLAIPSMECYVILEQHTPFAIVMRRTAAGFLRETYEGMDSAIDLPFIGCRLALHDIYDGIEFTATCVQEPEPEHELTRA